MRQERKYEGDGTLYHYCSTDALVNILKYKTIRLTPYNCLNDSKEWKLGLEHWQNITQSGNETVRALANWENLIYPSVFCASTDGDSLSQWRAYSGDAKGFAIGFDPNKIRELRFPLLEVCYDDTVREDEIRAAVEKLGHTQFVGDPNHELATYASAMALCAYKGAGFKEEKEVRLICPILRENDGSLRAKNPKCKVDFRVSSDFGIMPFVEISISADFVRSVGMGPKCLTNQERLREFLRSCAFDASVSIFQSEASYR